MRALRRGTFCALMLVAVSAAQTQVAAQAGRAQAIELTGEPATATSVRLRWRIVNPGVIGGIQVQRARPTAPSLYSVLATLPANATTHLDAGLQPGEIWIYRVLTIGMRTAQPSSSNSVWVKLPAASAPAPAPLGLGSGGANPNRPRPGIPLLVQDYAYENAAPLDPLEEEFLYQLNQYRAARGRGPVRPSVSLSLASHRFGQELVESGVYATTGGIPRNTHARARAVGIYTDARFDTVLITARAEPAGLLETLKSSALDNGILLDPAWKVVGISRNYGERDGAYRWVLDFASCWDVTIPLPGEDTDGRIDGNEHVRTRPPADALAARAKFTGYGDDGRPYSTIHCIVGANECWKDPAMNLGRSLRELSLPENMIGDWHVQYQFTESGAWHFNDAGRFDMTQFQMSLRINRDGTWISQGYRAFHLTPPAQAGTWTWVHDAGRNEEVVTFFRDNGRPAAMLRVHAAPGEMTFFAVDGGAQMRSFFRGVPADADKTNDPQVVFRPGLASFADPFPAQLRCASCPLPMAAN